MLPLPGLSSVSGKIVVAKFVGGLLSSDGGVLLLREIEQCLRVADRLAACIKDPRAPELITHPLADILRFRLLMIGAGYEDGADANRCATEPSCAKSIRAARCSGERKPARIMSQAESILHRFTTSFFGNSMNLGIACNRGLWRRMAKSIFVLRNQ